MNQIESIRNTRRLLVAVCAAQQLQHRFSLIIETPGPSHGVDKWSAHVSTTEPTASVAEPEPQHQQ